MKSARRKSRSSKNRKRSIRHKLRRSIKDGNKSKKKINLPLVLVGTGLAVGASKLAYDRFVNAPDKNFANAPDKKEKTVNDTNDNNTTATKYYD